MAAILTDKPAHVLAQNDGAGRQPQDQLRHDDRSEELGIWLSGLRSFLGARQRFARANAQPGARDAAREFEIVHAGLRRCSMLAVYILGEAGGITDTDRLVKDDISIGDLEELSEMFHEVISIRESLNNSSLLDAATWRAWSGILVRRFADTKAVDALIKNAESAGIGYLPATLSELVRNTGTLTPEHAELILVLPRFGMVLKWLSVVGRMLEADEPLKPSLLIFSRVNQLVTGLTTYINNRLNRFPDQNAELFATLDAAAYTASIELKKVYTQELSGIVSMRPTPSIFARIETAHSLLHDGFQQILTGFARVIEPDTDIFKLFPEFRVKQEHSIALRADLWAASQAVRSAEASPEGAALEAMRQNLKDFRSRSMKYLFYKDTETVERFIEEILVTKQTKDLVPILHRFGAYLDTLFGQVSLRAVLENEPFKPPLG